ncbi:MAG: hypothetical protein PWP04_750 [Candidatus Atribacteria bacterium]|nr:hypothetical protein [Candidatus Atribacteria bacterium]
MEILKRNYFRKGVILILFVWLISPGLSEKLASAANTDETLTLSQAIERALTHSQEVLAARDAVEMAELDLSIADSQDLSPNVTLSGNWPLWESWENSYQDFSQGIGVTIQDTFYLFKKSPSEKSAELLLEEAKNQLFLTEEAVKAQVVSLYLNILNQEKDYQVAQKTLEVTKVNFQDQKMKWEQGNASEIDLLGAQENLASAQAVLEQKEEGLITSRKKLNQLIGLPFDASPTLASPSPVSLPQEWNQPALVQRAKESRSESESLERERERKEIEKKEIQKATRPQVNLVGQYQTEDIKTSLALEVTDGVFSYQIDGGETALSSSSSSFAPDGGGWGVGLEISWKIWDGKTTSNQVKKAEIELEQIEREMEILPQTIEVEVEEALQQVTQAQSNRDLSALILKSAEASLRIAEQQAERGIITNREVMQSELQYLEALTNRQKTENELWGAFISLLQTLGEEIKVEGNEAVVPSFLYSRQN